MTKIIALGAIARTGKNSCANILAKYLQIEEFSFADELKKALDPICKEYHKISAFTQDDKEKQIIRPLLVAFGNSVREVNHRAWIDKLNHKINTAKCLRWYKDVFVITDIRFSEKNGDELDYVQKELKGIVVNIDRRLADGSLVQPANESEAKNYPIIKARADVNICASNLEELEQEVLNKIIPLIKG